MAIVKKSIKRKGKIVGWKLYKKGTGLFGENQFIGYSHKKKRR